MKVGSYDLVFANKNRYTTVNRESFMTPENRRLRRQFLEDFNKTHTKMISSTSGDELYQLLDRTSCVRSEHRQKT